jgi:hypothetical protein
MGAGQFKQAHRFFGRAHRHGLAGLEHQVGGL